ncbi:MAG: 30S ribosomal protein S21 [Candidatus Pacebacteria bacterium]|nr:30S ribosomal protein S21 [Candidatus Paceibacterota bacterium]MDD5722019.1 30S ribosomal protein S21 [Candidatus Paceibacterota bacterium]
MAITVKRRKGENINSFLSRAFRVIKRSGILLEARKRKYYKPKPTKRDLKLSALHKQKVLQEIERKRKKGLI